MLGRFFFILFLWLGTALAQAQDASEPAVSEITFNPTTANPVEGGATIRFTPASAVTAVVTSTTDPELAIALPDVTLFVKCPGPATDDALCTLEGGTVPQGSSPVTAIRFNDATDTTSRLVYDQPNGVTIDIEDEDADPQHIAITLAETAVKVKCKDDNAGQLCVAYVRWVGEEDADEDGIPDQIDVCPDSPLGSIVNEQGCAYSQLSTLYCDETPSGFLCTNGNNLDPIYETAGDRNQTIQRGQGLAIPFSIDSSTTREGSFSFTTLEASIVSVARWRMWISDKPGGSVLDGNTDCMKYQSNANTEQNWRQFEASIKAGCFLGQEPAVRYLNTEMVCIPGTNGCDLRCDPNVSSSQCFCSLEDPGVSSGDACLTECDPYTNPYCLAERSNLRYTFVIETKF